MTWFEDLTPYTYLDTKPTDPPTLNVGWLSPDHMFATGDVPSTLVARLEELSVHARTQPTRGHHWCELCPDDPDADLFPASSAEIRAVAVDGTRYAAPCLLEHYIADHHYLPPPAFIDAVLRNQHITWDHADANDLCMSCGTALELVKRDEGFVEPETKQPYVSLTFVCHCCATTYRRRRSVPASP